MFSHAGAHVWRAEAVVTFRAKARVGGGICAVLPIFTVTVAVTSGARSVDAAPDEHGDSSAVACTFVAITACAIYLIIELADLSRLAVEVAVALLCDALHAYSRAHIWFRESGIIRT